MKEAKLKTENGESDDQDVKATKVEDYSKTKLSDSIKVFSKFINKMSLDFKAS